MEIGSQKNDHCLLGKGKNKEQGKSLWSGEGLKYFKRAEKKWREVCADDEKMQMMYGDGFESWLNKYGKDITVGKKVTKYCIWSWRGGL
jgi:hypothetical protein